LDEKVLLLADNDILIVAAMKPMLERKGFIVEVARNAKETIEKLFNLEKLNLLILEIVLPLAGAFKDATEGLEAGLKILRFIRGDLIFERWRDLPVLCYTIRSDNRRIQKELETLGAYVITKGKPPEVAVDKVLKILSSEFP
jgi:CheY-like chemotaxis protein